MKRVSFHKNKQFSNLHMNSDVISYKLYCLNKKKRCGTPNLKLTNNVTLKISLKDGHGFSCFSHHQKNQLATYFD